mgnify:CR=1 FL=1
MKRRALGCGLLPRFLHAQKNERYAEEPRDEGQPKDGLEGIFSKLPEEKRGNEGTRESACGVERLPQPVGGAEHLGRRRLRHEGVSRGAAQSLADAVKHACRKNGRHRIGYRKNRLCCDAEAVAEEHEELLAPKAVGDVAREDFGCKRNAFCGAFREAHSHHVRGENLHHEERQHGMNHFGRNVHQKAHKAENPDGARDGPGCAGRVRGGLSAWLRKKIAFFFHSLPGRMSAPPPLPRPPRAPCRCGAKKLVLQRQIAFVAASAGARLKFGRSARCAVQASEA